MRIYFYSWRLACLSGADESFAHTKGRRERNDCKWNSAVFPEFFTLNNASTSGRPHTTANPHGPPAAPTQLFSVFPLAGSRPLIACLRDHIHDATVHCVLGDDDLYLVYRMFFIPGSLCAPLTLLQNGPDVFFKAPVTVIRSPSLRRKHHRLHHLFAGAARLLYYNQLTKKSGLFICS